MNFLDSSDKSGQTRAMFLKIRAKIFDLWLIKVFAKRIWSTWSKSSI